MRISLLVSLAVLAACRPGTTPPGDTSDPTPTEDLERLFVDIASALRGIEFFKTRNAEGVMRTIREIAHRTPLDLREVKLLRAIAIEVTKYGERLARSRLHVDRQ